MVEHDYLPLDNSRNERPDWREYWPIRHRLLREPPEDDSFYGFLSPAFRTKTRLEPAAVFEFVASNSEADVLLFSPFFDQIAFFLNAWEQGVLAHPASRTVFEQAAALVAPSFRIQESVGCSRNTVYCNYFIARGRFWKSWLERCERLFELAETGDQSEVGRALNAPLQYQSGAAAAKVFVIERVASAMLASEAQWKVRAFDSMRLPCSNSPISTLGAPLMALDALKIAFLAEGRSQYLQAFFNLRAQFADQVRARSVKAP